MPSSINNKSLRLLIRWQQLLHSNGISGLREPLLVDINTNFEKRGCHGGTISLEVCQIDFDLFGLSSQK